MNHPCKIRKQRLLKTSIAFLFAGFLILPAKLNHISSGQAHKTGGIQSETLLRQFGFYLEEVTEQSHVEFTHYSPRLDPIFDPILPQIASMGASIAVSDFDNDGWNDFYITSSRFSSLNALYHNEKDGTFKDVAKHYHIADLNVKGSGVSMGAVWADFDNDGYEDLFIYKWGRPELYRNNRGKSFINVTQGSGLPEWINANTAIWFDYNSDGNIDLFIGGYFPEDIDLWHLKTSRVLTESFEYARNGGRNYLLKNTGNGHFKDVTAETGLISTRWTLAAGAADLNEDGFPELIIANDYGIDEFYDNDNGERFRERSSDAMIGFSPKSGMNVTFGDTYNNGKVGIYISNITEEGILLQGNNFWVPVNVKGKMLYENTAREDGIESAGWSYGAQFTDLNNDGAMDLYVANGYISGQKGTNYWYDYSKVTGGNTAIISDVKNWPAMKGRSQSGYQQNRIWINEGHGHFYDVAGYMPDASTYDSRAVAVADLWNRGVEDILVANQNNRLTIYKNNVVAENNWIAFELEGTVSNRSAIGSTVRITWDHGSQKQIVTGGIGFCSQNQRRVHFGLGKSLSVKKAEIIWPNGKKQVIHNPETGIVHKIRETI